MILTSTVGAALVGWPIASQVIAERSAEVPPLGRTATDEKVFYLASSGGYVRRLERSARQHRRGIAEAGAEGAKRRCPAA